jgi:hypothetical protein
MDANPGEHWPEMDLKELKAEATRSRTRRACCAGTRKRCARRGCS